MSKLTDFEKEILKLSKMMVPKMAGGLLFLVYQEFDTEDDTLMMSIATHEKDKITDWRLVKQTLEYVLGVEVYLDVFENPKHVPQDHQD